MKKTAFTISTILLAVASFVIAGKVLAQTTLPLSVTPPRQEVLINPVESYSTSVKFQNLGDTPVSGTINVVDFIVQDNKGTPVFLDNPLIVGTTTIPAKYSAAKWVKLYTDRATIAANGNVSVPITINVPKNANPGGRYTALYFEPAGALTLNNSTSAGETPIAIRIASLIYIRVAGPITEKAMVTKFQVPSFLEYGPVSIATEITNLGDYHIAPIGTIALKDVFGRTVASSAIEPKNVFPGTSRAYDTKIGDKLMFGKFTVNLSATYGATGKTLLASAVLWVFPWKVMLAVVLALAIIIILILTGYKRFVKTEAKLVEQVREEKSELEALKEKFKDNTPGGSAPKESSPEKPNSTK